jgi:hypothetical protein
MCNCLLNPCACSDAPELPYLTGAAGEDGLYGGFSYHWKFLSTTGAVGSTYLNFDNSDYTLVTTIKIHETVTGGINMGPFLTVFNNSGDYGLIKITKEFDSTTFWCGTITNIVDSGSFRTITVTYADHNNSFTTDDVVVVTFTPFGAAGSDASTKAYTKESFIGNNTYYETKGTTGLFTTDLTTASGELAANGDTVIGDIVLRQPDNAVNRVRMVVGGTVVGDNFSINGGKCDINIELVRKSTTLLHYVIKVKDVYNYAVQDEYYFEGFVTVADVSANPFDIEAEITTLASANLDLYKMQSKYILV